MPPVFLDVNLFMYAAGRPHPLKEPCIRILSDVERRYLQAAINTEVLQELLYRYSHIGLAGKGIQLCREVLKYPLAVLPVTLEDIHVAVELFDAHRSQGITPRDAIHAATMQNHGLTQIISADTDFDRLSFVTRRDPLAYSSPPLP